MQDVIQYLINNADVLLKVKEGTASLVGVSPEQLKAILEVFSGWPNRFQKHITGDKSIKLGLFPRFFLGDKMKKFITTHAIVWFPILFVLVLTFYFTVIILKFPLIGIEVKESK